jgi:parallel beta-helix repeat protein
MKQSRNISLSCLALIVLVTLGGQAFAATVAVGTCTTLVNFATIQLAVNAVPANSTIKVCPGTYPEQILITKNLTLAGFDNGNQDAAVIVPPTTGAAPNAVDLNTGNPIAAQILVTAGTVAISNLTVDGIGNQISGCAPDFDGILYQNASGTINHVALRNQVEGDALNGCQSGDGLYVESSGSNTSAVVFENGSVHNYNKNGVTGRYAGTNLTVSGSYVQGSGLNPFGLTAQNGIEIADGASGKIASNTVIDNLYGVPADFAATDILLYDAAESRGITISGNVLGNSQIPIAIVTDTAGLGDGVSVTTNKIFGTNTYDGIDVCTNNNTVTGNTIYNSAESAIHLDASCGSTGTGNIVQTNTMVESACAGILVDAAATGNNTTGDIYWSVPFQIASSTSACTIPGAPARAKIKLKYSPSK